MVIQNFNFQVILIMTGYAILNALGSLFLRKGLVKKEGNLKSFLKLNKTIIRDVIDLLKNPIWVLGLLLLGSDFIFYQFALKNYEVSVVKPLVNLNLIFVIFFGVKFMKDKITPKEIISICMIVAGAVSVTYMSEESSTYIMYGRLFVFVLLIFILIAIGVILLIVTKKSGMKNYEYFGAIFSGGLYGIGTIFNKSLFGFSNGFSIFEALILLLFVGSYGFAFMYGQFALSEGRLSIVAPISNITSIIIPFIGGIIIFGDNLFIPISGNIVFPLSFIKLIGLILIIAGVILIYKKPQSK